MLLESTIIDPAVEQGCRVLAPDVAVLFARRDSVYKTLPGCDVFDAARDARTFRGGMSIVAHPPCRAWGRLRHFARPVPGEQELALWTVCMVRIWGGVIEHPSSSLLWPTAALPEPGQRDAWGGWTLSAPQMWWGHRAEKSTRFYVVGCEPNEMPAVPLVMGEASHVIQTRKREDYRPHVPKAEREHTPPALAQWLLELARTCRSQNNQLFGAAAALEQGRVLSGDSK